jgi:hypothetical protein
LIYYEQDVWQHGAAEAKKKAWTRNKSFFENQMANSVELESWARMTRAG